MTLLVSVGRWTIRTAVRDDRTLFTANLNASGATFGRQAALEALAQDLEVAPLMAGADGGMYCLALGTLFYFFGCLLSWSRVRFRLTPRRQTPRRPSTRTA